MYEQLKSRVASLLARPRSMKPQTERQLAHHLAEHSGAGTASFLLCAAAVLEDYELDILFAPVFTATLDERAELADLLFHWRPTPEQLTQLIADLCEMVPSVPITLPDGGEAQLTLHEVMIERFVRLLRLDAGPDAPTAAALRESLPADLWPIGIALLCERGMTPAKQAWLTSFVGHVASRHPITRGLLEVLTDFIAGQPTLDRPSLVQAADSLLRAAQGTAAYTSSGHAYWSADVAQHHHYRGQGHLDTTRIAQQQAELEQVAMMVEDLRTFEVS
jgi:hypothetical protein